MRYQNDINTHHNIKSIGRAAVAQLTERLARKGQTRVRNWKGAKQQRKNNKGSLAHQNKRIRVRVGAKIIYFF